MFGGIVFVAAEAADGFGVGVKNFELLTKEVFNFNALFVGIEGLVDFAHRFSNLGEAEPEPVRGGIKGDGLISIFEGLV